MPLTLLIAEGNPDLRELLASLFEEEGYGVLAVGLPREVQEACDRRHFDAILTDSWFGGRESTIDDLLSIAAAAGHTPLLLMSGWETEPLAARVGAVGWIDKPFGIDELVGMVSAAIEDELPADSAEARIANQYFAALGSHDFDGLAALCTEDVVYSLPGSSPYASEVHGRKPFRDFAVETFTRFPQATFSNVKVYARSRGVVARYEGAWEDAGRQHRLLGAVLFGLREGRISNIGVRLNQERLTILAGAGQLKGSSQAAADHPAGG